MCVLDNTAKGLEQEKKQDQVEQLVAGSGQQAGGVAGAWSMGLAYFGFRISKY